MTRMKEATMVVTYEAESYAIILGFLFRRKVPAPPAAGYCRPSLPHATQIQKNSMPSRRQVRARRADFERLQYREPQSGDADIVSGCSLDARVAEMLTGMEKSRRSLRMAADKKVRSGRKSLAVKSPEPEN